MVYRLDLSLFGGFTCTRSVEHSASAPSFVLDFAFSPFRRLFLGPFIYLIKASMAFLLRLAMLLTIFNLASAIPCPAPPSPPPSSCGPPSSPPAPRVPPPAPKSLSQPASRPVSPGKANGLKSFAAIGDSYAAGLGSGIFVDTAPDVSESEPSVAPDSIITNRYSYMSAPKQLVLITTFGTETFWSAGCGLRIHGLLWRHHC